MSKTVVPLRAALTLAALLACVGLSQAQSSRPAAPSGDAFVRQVRVALGRGQVDDAKTIVSGNGAPAGSRDLATALVEIFQGQDDAARPRLERLASSNREAALELALLEQRHGQRDDANRRLASMTALNTPNTTDDYLVLARAARAAGDLQLSKTAFLRIENAGRADVLSDFGDLFFQAHQYGDAADEYRKAIAIDGKWVAAHLGLARAVADEDPEQAAQELALVHGYAPADPDLWLLTAERALAAEDFAAAQSALDQVATVRPGTLQEAALRGAVAYALRKPADIDAALGRVHAIDPASAFGYRTVAQEAARKYRFQDAADLVRQGIAIDPADADAQADLGLYLLRTGDEPAARQALEAAWKLDDFNRTTFNLLNMMDSLDQFTVVQDGELVFKFPKDEAAVLKAYALPLGEEALKTYTQKYGFTPAGPILVEVFPKHDDFAVRTIGIPGMTGALGACFGRVVTMDSPKARPPGDFSWQATEWHELAHVFTLQLSDYRVPRWLTEGLSVYEEHQRVPAWGRELTIEYARNLARGRTFGIKGMSGAFKHPETLSLAYFEASLVAEYLDSLKGYEGLRALLKAYAGGATDADALASTYGQSLDDLDRGFGAWIKERYGQLSAALADPPSQVDPKDIDALKARATAAPGNFYSQWTYGKALFDAGRYADARPVLELAAQLAPPVDGSISPHGLLAQIAEKENDLPRARKELRALLSSDHQNVDAARHLAELAAKTNATDDQDFALRLVADLDPFDGPVHTELGKRELAKGRQPQAVIEFEAALALDPPNLAEAHTDLGEALVGVGRRDEAKKEALQALQLAPTYTRAQDLLLAVATPR